MMIKIVGPLLLWGNYAKIEYFRISGIRKQIMSHDMHASGYRSLVHDSLIKGNNCMIVDNSS